MSNLSKIQQEELDFKYFIRVMDLTPKIYHLKDIHRIVNIFTDQEITINQIKEKLDEKQDNKLG